MDAYLNHLYGVIKQRHGASAVESYVAKLHQAGLPKVAQKVGEEVVETVIAAMRQNKPEIINESSDLLFHLLILWAECNVSPDEVFAEMQRREGTSGLTEKNNRKE